MLHSQLKTMMAGIGVAGAVALPAYLLIFRPYEKEVQQEREKQRGISRKI